MKENNGNEQQIITELELNGAKVILKEVNVYNRLHETEKEVYKAIYKLLIQHKCSVITFDEIAGMIPDGVCFNYNQDIVIKNSCDKLMTTSCKIDYSEPMGTKKKIKAIDQSLFSAEMAELSSESGEKINIINVYRFPILAALQEKSEKEAFKESQEFDKYRFKESIKESKRWILYRARLLKWTPALG